MSIRIPEPARAEIIAEVYRLADEQLYLDCSRPESSRFMASLVDNPQVGGRLAEYLGNERVRTYIKDTILNKYAKQRRKPKKSLVECAQKLIGSQCDQIGSGMEGVCIFGFREKVAVLTAVPHAKWEVGLRRILLYVAGHDTVASRSPRLAILIHGFRLGEHDRQSTERALKLAGVIALWDS